MSIAKTVLLGTFMGLIFPAAAWSQKPAFTGRKRAEFVAGQMGAFTVTATGTPRPTFTAGERPKGLNISADGKILWKPTTAGTFSVTIIATNSAGNAQEKLTLMVYGPASITSASKTTFFAGKATSFTVKAAGVPAPALTLTYAGKGSPPAGIAFAASTGMLTSTAATPPGKYAYTLRADNGVGSDSQDFTLTVVKPAEPHITSPNATSFTVGTPGSFVVTATGTPTPLLSYVITSSQPTPEGLKFAPDTGALTSTAVTPAGTYKLTFTAHNGAGHDTQTFTLTVARAALGGEIVRPVIGFEQVGASATAGSQSFLFDFYISRPVPLPYSKGSNAIWGSRVRWWGDVKVSSYPYTQKSSVATFAPQFAASFGNQNLNKLAQSVEFVSGPEVRLWTTGSRGSITDESAAARFGLMWFAYFGATGPNNPTDNATVFQAPFAGSTQASLLNEMFPLPNGGTYSTCPAPTTPPTPCSNYVAFVPISADRFLQQWGTGIRLYSLYTHKLNGNVSFTTPATIEFSIGENAAVTAGHLHGPVLRVGAMYPFSIGPRGSPGSMVIFLFGSVDTALGMNSFRRTLTLIPALDSNGNPVPVSAAGVTQIPVDPNRRDTYRIGVGIDLVTLWNKLTSARTSP